MTEFERSAICNKTDADKKAAQLEQEFIKAQTREKQQALTAPVEGTVQQLAVHTVGGVVTPAQSLMVIAPTDYSSEIEVVLENKDVGFVKAGQAAEVMGGDNVVENPGEGTDTVQSSITYTLTANVENLVLTGTAAINGYGNALNNTLTGNAGKNILDGGPGADIMDGGEDQDFYYVDNVNDVVNKSGTDSAFDNVYTTVDRTIDANIELLRAIHGSIAHLYGDSRDNRLIGSDDCGINILEGKTGNDIYNIHPNDVAIELPGEGIDLVKVGGDYTLPANIENLELFGSLNNTGNGNALDNTFTGNIGNNTLSGQGGADTLIGGAGNDTYILGRAYGADIVQGNDATAGNIDVAKFLTGVATTQVWFKQSGNNLEASILGTADEFIVQDWALGTQYRVEQFKTTDGNKTATTTDANFASLVQAMTAVGGTGSATSIAEVAMSAAQRTGIESLLAVWQ